VAGEYLYGSRKDMSNDKGHANRVNVMLQYSFWRHRILNSIEYFRAASSGAAFFADPDVRFRSPGPIPTIRDYAAFRSAVNRGLRLRGILYFLAAKSSNAAVFARGA